jgi:hypothetical protein
MTNRTIQIFGQGYGSAAISANAQVNGNVVFTGEIPTVDQPAQPFSPDPAVLFEFELPLDTVGSVPVLISFTGAETVYIGQVQSNYVVRIDNPVYTSEDLAILRDPNSTRATKLPIYERAANPPLTGPDILIIQNGTQEELLVILKQHNLSWSIPSPDQFISLTPPATKRNVVINSIAVVPGDIPLGEWWWPVPLINGTGIISFNLQGTVVF